MLEEKDVGICAYANDAPGFDAILRHRYTDFKVNEIGPDMEVAVLTSLEEPKSLLKVATSHEFTQASLEACAAAFSAVAEERHVAKLREFLAIILAQVRLAMSTTAPSRALRAGTGLRPAVTPCGHYDLRRE